MNTLTISASVAAIVTVMLNAHHGYQSTAVFHYAVVFATLNGALDIAKCSCLIGMGKAWNAGRPFSAIALLLLFVPLFLNSLWCGVSEVTISRTTGTTQHVVDTQTRTRTEAEHTRLTAELATMQNNPTFTATAACALPKSNQAKAFCGKVADTKAALTRINAQLSAPAVADPQPQLTLLGTLTGLGLPTLQFADALKLVVLAELVGSVGFYLGTRINPKVPQKPVERISWWRAVQQRLVRKTQPGATPKPLAVVPAEPATATMPTVTVAPIRWKIPRANVRPT